MAEGIIQVSAIPTELTALPQWVVWKLQNDSNGKPTKVPYCAADVGRRASTTDPATWAPFDVALTASGSCSGVGFVFTATDPYCGIDLDKSLEPNRGAIQRWAAPFVERLNSYCEVSPSGAGLKLWVRATLPVPCRHKKNKMGASGGAIEVYDRERFFTVTGDRLESSPAVAMDRQAEVDAIYAELFPSERQAARAAMSNGAGHGLDADDATLIDRAKRSKNGTAFARLWGGDTSDAGGDHSSADLALCNMLAFWTGPDAGRIDRLFRQSGLNRDKWEKRPDYRERTIKRAIDDRTEFFEAGVREDDSQFGSAMQHAARTANGNGNGDKGEAASAQPAEPPAISNLPRLRPRLSNVVDRSKEIENKKSRRDDSEPEKKIIRWQEYRSLPAIAADIHKLTGGWPREAGGMLFALKPNTHPLPVAKDVQWITDPNKLFSWLGGVADVHWSTAVAAHPTSGERQTPPTKAELFEYLMDNSCESYRGVEYLPHIPPVDDIFYMPVRLPVIPPSPTPLAQLVERFNGENEIDKALMLAALLTPGWSGAPGTKPTFVFTSDFGRGTGKTTTAVILAEVWGGAVQIRPRNADWEKVCGRLLGDAAMNKRILFIDNVKGTLAGSEIEGLITSPNIDGWKPYVGQASRPNLFTWYLTMNATRFSSDITDRAVSIKLGKPKHSFNFNEWARNHISKHRAEILAEIFEILAGQALCEIQNERRDRWMGWQDAILTRFDIGNEMAQEIIDRRPSMNADLETAETIAAAVLEMIIERHPVTHKEEIIRIPRELLRQKMVANGIVEKSDDIRKVTSIVLDQCGTGPLNFLIYDKAKVKGITDRFWFYRGENVPAESELTEAVAF